MGRTWPNVDAETVVEPGYYWNERLKKLARLSIGEKLPHGVGPWEMVARQGEMSSSQVARAIFDRYPHLNVNEFTYTTTSPLPRRLPMGDPLVRRRGLVFMGAVGVFALGAAAGWWLSRWQFIRAHETEHVRFAGLKEFAKAFRRERPLAPAMREIDLWKMAVP